MKIYLASPLFTEFERENVKAVANYLRSKGHSVYGPMEHSIENAWDYPNHEWAQMVFDEDVKAIRECDEVHCIYYGLYSDSGTAWECGFAYGIGKTVRQLVYNFGTQIFSLMMINGCDEFDLMGNYLFDRDDEIKIEQK